MTIAGGFLSTMFPLYGPLVVLLPATSKTVRLPVEALLVSVPAGTDVTRLKLASAGLASPEFASLAVQARETSLACHSPSGKAQETEGAISSKHMAPLTWSEVKPLLSHERTCR